MPFSDDLAHPAASVRQSLCEIWNRKQIGKVYDVYQHNVELHTPDGCLYGREVVIRSITLRLAAFPNLSYTVEDLICAMGEQDTFKVAVRWTMAGKNTGYTEYGPPTGREVVLRGMSHFRLKKDRVVEQWTVDNELSLLRQLGLEAADLAHQRASRGAFDERTWGAVERVLGQATPEVMPPPMTEAFDVEDLILRSRHEIWNWCLLGTIDKVYAEDVAFHGPSDLTIGDREDFKAYVLSMLAAFPDLEMLVDDVVWSDDGEGRYRASARWSLLGTHRGSGPYGSPSGNRVRVTGVTDNVIRGGRIVEEWTELGEFALLKQIHRSIQGSVEAPDQMDAGQSITDTQQDMRTGDDTGNGDAGEQ